MRNGSGRWGNALACAVACLLVGVQVFAAESPKVSIDAAKTGEPISKYVYGQFMEHLGQCIYGGTWAEMLVDRKFFYPVTGDVSKAWGKTKEEARILVASPWLIVGEAGALKMQKEKVYVKDQQAPEFTLTGKPAGLAQEELGLVKDKEYVGRVILAGDASAAPVEVSLVWGEGPKDRETVKIDALKAEYAKYPVKFKAGASSDKGRFEIVSKGTGKLWIATASLMPGDNIKGWRKDTVEVLKKLNAPVYRWPGGNFVSGYNWRDGLGEADRRPTRKNPAWTGIEYNDVGIHEFMELCGILNTEPYIAVNTGLGTVEETAQEVEYVNGAATTPQGKLRAENGHPEPYNCKWWGVGNEMFGNWQLGHMPQKEYIVKHNKVADAMWAVDKSIQLIGVGNAGDGWTQNMFAGSADKMNLISEHTYFQDKPDVPAHVNLSVAAIKAIADTHRKLRAEMPELKDKKIPIALDEWNYWYGPHVFGELGTRYFLKDGIGIAAGLHEIYRNSDLFFMANYAQTVNVIGCIKTTKTAAELETTGLVLALYRAQFGVTPVAVSGVPKPLDVVAAWTADKKVLTVSVVNPGAESCDLSLDVAGAKLSGKGKSWTMAGKDPMAYNDPGQPRKLDFVEKAVDGAKTTLKIEPLSVILFRLDVE